MRAFLLKWMVRCSLPLSLTMLFTGCSNNETSPVNALDGDVVVQQHKVMGDIAAPAQEEKK